MFISAVICTHNRANYLTKAIQSLLEQHAPKEQYEIIVVDNYSTDSTKEVVEQFSSSHQNIRYIYESTLGLSYARNTGWRNARGKYVAYLDDDAIAGPSWIDTIIEVFETINPRPGCVGGRANAIWEAPRPDWLSDELSTGLTIIDWSDVPHALPDLRQQWLVGANIAFPKEVLEQLNGFADGLDRAGTKMLSGGDVFLEQQIIDAGYSCFYHPRMVIDHHIQKSRLEKHWLTNRYYWQGVSDAAMGLIKESPSPMARLIKAFSRLWKLITSINRVKCLILPNKTPQQFTEKCFALIELGHVAGLLGAAGR